jgi:hypothetical protein
LFHTIPIEVVGIIISLLLLHVTKMNKKQKIKKLQFKKLHNGRL